MIGFSYQNLAGCIKKLLQKGRDLQDAVDYLCASQGLIAKSKVS